LKPPSYSSAITNRRSLMLGDVPREKHCGILVVATPLCRRITRRTATERRRYNCMTWSLTEKGIALRGGFQLKIPDGRQSKQTS
jgi:hypothetical protein